MPYADPAKQKQAQAEWYKRNKELTLSRNKKWREKNPTRKQELDKRQLSKGHMHRKRLLEEHGAKCQHCQFEFDGTNGYLFDFHHIDPSKKKFAISAGNLKANYEKLRDEASKCLLLCCMCHRIVHHKQDIPENVKL